MAVHRDAARRYTIWAKAAAVALVALAGAAVALPGGVVGGEGGGGTGAESGAAPAGEVATTAQTGPTAGESSEDGYIIDRAFLTSVLWDRGPAWTEPKKEDSKPAETTIVNAPSELKPSQTQPSEPSVRYVGSIAGPKGMHALLSINNTQRLLGLGQEHAGISLLSIAPDHVMIRESGAEKRIDLAERTAGWANLPPPDQSATSAIGRAGIPNARMNNGYTAQPPGRGTPNYPPRRDERYKQAVNERERIAREQAEAERMELERIRQYQEMEAARIRAAEMGQDPAYQEPMLDESVPEAPGEPTPGDPELPPEGQRT